jgi:hypothetical protein
LVGSLLHLSDFDFSRPLTAVWFVVLAGGIVLALTLYVAHERRARMAAGAAATRASAA